MAKRKNRGARNKKKKQKSSDSADLQSPVHLPDIDTPTSSSSLTCTPSDLTPPVAAFSSLTLDSPDSDSQATIVAPMESSDTLPMYGGSSLPDAQPADVHSKLREKTLLYSRTNAINRFHGAFATGKMLQQVLGLQPPKPCVRPPSMPKDLEQRFRTSLQEYGVDLKTKAKRPMDTLRQATQEKEKQKTPGKASLEGSSEAEGCASTVLFPSPRVERAVSWHFVQTKTGNMPEKSAPAVHAKPPFSMPFLEEREQAPSVPQIKIQPPSPTKVPTSRKRRPPSQSHEQFGPPLLKSRATDDTTGLPVLAADQEELWKADFPGNTNALFTIMLPWSLSMKHFNEQLKDECLFSINAAFPYPVEPPIHQKLVSAAFYDDSTAPHKEIRFIGPGDNVDISYNAVDIFTYPDDTEIDSAQAQHDNKVAAMKRALGFDIPHKDVRHMSMQQSTATGEGRWAYILIQGHHSAFPGETPPHVIIAWHISAVTASSKCLHTIYPGGSNAPKRTAAPPAKGLKRFSSLQNWTARSKHCARLRQNLRSASHSELPGMDVSATAVDDGALTLLREVCKMEKAGCIPLVEGHRVDVGAWRGWLDAVGEGKGKVVMWRERE